MSTLKTSTPARFPVARPPLRRQDLANNSCSLIMSGQTSPLSSKKTRTSPRRHQQYDDYDEKEQDVEGSETEDESEQENQKDKIVQTSGTNENFGVPKLFVGFFVFAIIIGYACSYLNSTDQNNSVEPSMLDELRSKYPKQSNDLWSGLELAVNKKKINQPLVLIMLYKNSANEENLNKLLKDIANFLVCSLSNCEYRPLFLSSDDFNTEEAIRDHGTLIEKYGQGLKLSKVMVVQNLDQVSGKTAQVFHSFCDEVTPVVAQSYFIFTIKVDEIPKNMIKFIEDYLTVKWKDDIPFDILNPLLTRLVNYPVVYVE